MLEVIFELCIFFFVGENVEVFMDVFLVYRDDTFVEWIEMVYERVFRKFKCIFTFFKVGYFDV